MSTMSNFLKIIFSTVITSAFPDLLCPKIWTLNAAMVRLAETIVAPLASAAAAVRKREGDASVARTANARARTRLGNRCMVSVA